MSDSSDRRDVQQRVDEEAAAAGFALLALGRYRSGDVLVDVERVDGPGSVLLHPRVALVAPYAPDLSRLLEASIALRLPDLVDHVVDGRVYTHRPLRSEKKRYPESWVLDPKPAESPERYKLWEVDSSKIERASRQALMLAIELQLRANLAPWDGKEVWGVRRGAAKALLGPENEAGKAPPWVAKGRSAHVRLLAELGGERLEAE